jgi:hypothetical protein
MFGEEYKPYRIDTLLSQTAVERKAEKVAGRRQ